MRVGRALRTHCSRLGRAGTLGAALALAFTGACAANDSSVELSVGGLVFTRNADVSMESEDLTITPEQVTVKYQFLNKSDKPVSLTVAFPLPDVDLSDPGTNYAIPTTDPVNFVGFQTTIDGQPVAFETKQNALLDKKDITERLKALAMPLLPSAAQQAKIDELTPAAREALINEGLLVPAGTDVKGKALFEGSWIVQTSFVRQQVFPPGKPVAVEHRYRTSMGISMDTVLRKSLRENKALAAEFQRYRTEYCVPDELLRGIDKVAGPAEANTAKLQERRISYVLKTGANWAGPIKDFRLVVDKGRPNRLVSFCLPNVKKISPTSFEVRAKDFTPDKDLKILLISRFE